MCNKKYTVSHFVKAILYCIGIWFFNQQAQAQNSNKIQSFYQQRQAIVEFDKGSIINNEDIIYYTEEYINKLFPQYEIKFKSIKRSPFSSHLLFQQRYETLPVYQGSVMVNIANDGRVLSIINNLIDFNYTKPAYSNNIYNCIYYDGEKPLSVLLDSITNNVGLLERVFYNNEIIYTNILTSYLNPIDTTVKAKVFNPDPITTANVVYGGSYSDFNDSNVSILNNEMQFQNLRLKYDSGYFIFENNRVKIKKINPVVYYDTAVKGSIPIYGRGDKNFEGLNCIYHITEANEYINNLSFKLGNYQIWVDPHGRSDDNSAFTNDGQNRYIKFGDGGIDDAEDADPIIHEYHHGIYDEASQSQNIGLYRKSMEEGSCDYAAASYSKYITSYQWQKVYNWDGNNNFDNPQWLGRTVQSTRKYPTDLSGGNIYNNGEIWSTFLMNLEASVGRDYLHKLLYQSFYSAALYIDFPTMAKLLLQSDTLINGAANCWKICMELTKSNILICGTPVQQAEKQNIDMVHTDKFVSVKNTSDKILNLTVLSMDGKLMLQQLIPVNVTETLDKSALPQGIYIVNICNEKINYTKKIAVY
ncbi:MAG: T9SS type A sorting domain-containing protein [Bacteroidota bacterium]|nr:T9SS type A sorting domain-containing protein [Bacteroidota bacterium]